VAVLAEKYYERGLKQDAAEHKPVYLRVSQAEREGAAAKSEAELKAMAAGHIPGRG
jgi:hypothetical protein